MGCCASTKLKQEEENLEKLKPVAATKNVTPGTTPEEIVPVKVEDGPPLMQADPVD